MNKLKHYKYKFFGTQEPQYSAPKEITYTTTPPPPPATNNSYSAPVSIAYASSQPLQPAYAHVSHILNDAFITCLLVM
jgi:hypothetical protein